MNLNARQTRQILGTTLTGISYVVYGRKPRRRSTGASEDGPELINSQQPSHADFQNLHVTEDDDLPHP